MTPAYRAKLLALGATLLVLPFLPVGVAFGQTQSIGFVKTVLSDATISVGGQSAKAVSGMALQKGFVVKTGSSGSLGIALRDNTVISLGPDTEFVVEDYQFEPGKGELNLLARISKGTLQYVSGMIAKLKPEAVAVRTPRGIVGVRGTRFLVRVEEEAP